MKQFTLSLFIFLFFSINPSKIYAAQTCGQDTCSAISDTATRATCYEQLVSDCRNNANTLSGEITNMNNQINATAAKIENTKYKINVFTAEINDLGDEITRLEGVLTQRSELLLRRVPATYKESAISQFGMLFFSRDFSDFITKIRYLTAVQKQDALLLFQVKATQNNYSERKLTREDKKKQLLAIQQELVQQNIQLAKQKQQKNDLLAVTQGNEATYNQLLVQAKAQLAAFQGYVQSQGGLTLINADPNWPSGYFSQRDVRWGGSSIAGFYSSGATVYTIGQAGCLISSVAMVLTHRGNNTNPGIIGSNGSYFFDSNFLWNGLTGLGFNTPQRTLDSSSVDNILSQGKWAIVGISSTRSIYTQPFHFVVVTGKNGNDYNLFDPWEGPNTSYNSKYSSGYITEVISY